MYNPDVEFLGPSQDELTIGEQFGNRASYRPKRNQHQRDPRGYWGVHRGKQFLFSNL